MLLFALLSGFAIDRCNAPRAISTVNHGATNYVAPTYHAQTYTPTYNVGTSYYGNYQQSYYPTYAVVDYRASYVGFTAYDEERARLLLIVEQQSKAAEKANERLQSQVEQLLKERAASRIEDDGPPVSPDGGDEDGVVPTGGKTQGAGASNFRLAAYNVMKTKCAQCHAGAAGEKNGWVMPANAKLVPSIEERLLVNAAITDKDNPMPKGGKLTREEFEAFARWTAYDKRELRAKKSLAANDLAASSKR